jgi:mRNA interferase RelE/StbE
MSFDIQYHESVVKEDIPKTSTADRERIKRAIEDKLAQHPEQFGRPLRRSLRGYRKLRVGDYRVIFRIEKRKVNVLVIQHRSIVYKTGGKRLVA